MHFTPFFFLAAVICLHTVAGNTAEARILESESDGAYRYGTPNYIDDSVFDSALQHPNATGTVSFTGRNVSASYSSRDVNGWTLRVNVTSGIIKPGSDDRQLTGSAISILQPAGLPTSGGNNGTDGFQVCVNIMRIVLNMTTNYTQLATDDAGTCGSYMSEECRNELRDLAVSRFQENETCSYNNDPPPSCGNIIFNPAATRFNEADFGVVSLVNGYT